MNGDQACRRSLIVGVFGCGVDVERFWRFRDVAKSGSACNKVEGSACNEVEGSACNKVEYPSRR